jgi:hypothetical protein
LSLAPQKEEVDALISQTKQLDENIYQAKKDAAEIDKKVQEAMGAETYKKSTYDIHYTKKDQGRIDRYNNLFNRSNDLMDIANNTYDPTKGAPKNLTANIQKAVDSLTNSRNIIQELSANFGLDKYDTNEALTKEIQARLSRSADGTKKLTPIVEEFYNKILSDGILKAQQWLESTKAANEKNILAQESKLKKVAQGDTTSVQKLEAEVRSAEESLGKTFHQRVNKWSQSIQAKIVKKQSGNLNADEEALIVKEIDDLFAIMQQAERQYTQHYKSAINPAINAQKNINISTSRIAELERLKTETHNQINLEEEKNIQEQIKSAQLRLKEYQEKRRATIQEANKSGTTPELSFIDSGIADVEKLIDDLYAQSNLRKEQEIQNAFDYRYDHPCFDCAV